MIHLKIKETFEKAIFSRFERGSHEDNTYIPNERRKFVCVAKTVEPETKGFNETFEHIHKQLKSK